MFKKLIKLGFLMAAWLLIGIPVAKAVDPPSFSLSPATGNYYVGCNVIETDILIHTNNNQTDSANVIIGYDPAYLEVIDQDGGVAGKQIAAGSAYGNYTGNTVDETEGTIKLTGFNIVSPYNSGSNFGTFGTMYFNVLQDGNTSLTIDFTQGETTDSNIAEYQTSDDLLNDAANASYTLVDDTVDPTLASYSPASGAEDVAVSQNVAFSISDVGCGVDLSELTVQVDGTTYTRSVSPTFGYSGNSSQYNITVNPSQNFSFDDTINVSIYGEDTEENDVSNSYSFDTIADTAPPYVTSKSPAADATSVNKTSNVTFSILDAGSGVDISEVIVDVEGVEYTQGGQNTFQYWGGASNYSISVNPAGDFERSQVVDVEIDAKDLLGASMSQVSYSFTIVENLPPVVTTIPDKSVNAGNLLTFNIQAADQDGDTVSIAMESTTLPEGASYTAISSTQGIFTWQTYGSDEGQHSVDIVATDDGPGGVSDTETFIITVNEPSEGSNVAPVLTSMSNLTLYQGDEITLLVHATDQNQDAITLQASTTQTEALTLTNVSNGLAGLTIDTSELSTGDSTITVEATDNGTPNLEDEITFTVTVTALPSGGGECEVCETCETATCPTLSCPACGSCSCNCKKCDDTYETLYLELKEKLKEYESITTTTSHKMEDLIELERGIEEILIALPDEVEGVNVREAEEELEKMICPAQRTRYVPVEVEKDPKLEAAAHTDLSSFGKTVMKFEEGKDQEPVLVDIIPKNNSQEVSLFQPIVVIFADDKGLDKEKFAFKINDEYVYYEIEMDDEKGYPEYKITYIPENPYPENSKVTVTMEVQEEARGDAEPRSKKFTSYFYVGENTITEMAINTVKIESEPEDFGLEVNNIQVEVDQVTKKAIVKGSISQPSEVKATWYGRDDKLTISKYVVGKQFLLQSPMAFPDGHYWVEVAAENDYGIETEPIRIKFKSGLEELKFDNYVANMHQASENAKQITEQMSRFKQNEKTAGIAAILISLIVLLIAAYLAKQ
jgi:hypothetical protein